LEDFMFDFELDPNHPDARYLRREITTDNPIPGRVVKSSEYRATRVLSLTNVNPLLDGDTVIKDFSAYGKHAIVPYNPLIIRSQDM